MSDLQEPTPNISSLSVLYPEGNFPSHIDIFGKGGFIALNDAIGGSGYSEFINERVTLERRKPGMLVYINSDNTYHKCATAGSSESTGEWDRQYFSGRYFYGASAPTASDVVMGEKWFNTDVGSEFTYLPIDENQNTFFWVDIDHLGQGESGDIGIDLLVNGVSFATDSPTLNITGSSPINVASEGGNGYRISLTDNFVNTSGDNMTGTLTGTDASFDSITASNGFVGTLTGNNIRYTNAEFGTESLIIQGSSATFTDMSVMITGDSTFDINDMSIGTTFDAGNGQNLNVYRIFAQDGVALGGNDISKNNWLGNNVFLSPHEDHVVLIGLPLSRDADNHEKLTVTGGIVAKRIFATGSFYPGLTGINGGKPFNSLAHALAAGITTVDGNETPLFSVQDRQDGGWVNAPKIRRHWPTGQVNSTAKSDNNFELDEYITRRYAENNFTSRSTSSPPLARSKAWKSSEITTLTNWDTNTPTLTKETMGFDFPIKLVIKWIQGVDANSDMGSNWYINEYILDQNTTIKIDPELIIPTGGLLSYQNSLSSFDSTTNTIKIARSLNTPNILGSKNTVCAIEVYPVT